MESLLGRSVFSIKDNDYSWRNAILAAKFWGDWTGIVEQARDGLACLKYLEGASELPAPAEVEAAANEFRHAHILISAEETKAWLATWALSVGEWKDYFRRWLARQACATDIRALALQQKVTDEEVDRAIKAEAICSGQLSRLAFKLAGRAAVAEGSGLENIGLRSLPDDGERLKTLARMEAAFNQFCEQVATPGAIKQRIASNYIYLTWFDCFSVSFPEEQSAREAALCVREDEISLDEVAREAKRAVCRRSFYIDDAEAELVGHLLGSQKGDLLGPMSLGGQWVLFLINKKILPSESDTRVRERARLAILRSAINREVNNRVKWNIGTLPGISGKTKNFFL